MISLFCLLWVLPDLCSCPQTVASIVFRFMPRQKKEKNKKKTERQKRKKSLVYYCGRVAPSTGISYSLHIWTYWFWQVIIIMSFWEFTGDNVRPWSKQDIPSKFSQSVFIQLMKIYVSKDTLRQIFHNIYLLIYLFMFTEGNSVSICPHISNHDILLQ